MLWAAGTRPAAAQQRPPSTRLGSLALGGSIGVSTEAYGADGISARRPANTGVLFGSATATMGETQYGLDLYLSTEDDRLRQSMNRFTVSVSHAALAARLGDVSPTFSRYSLNGSTVRGAWLDVRPSFGVLSLLAGRSRRAIDTGIGAAIRRPAYDRSLVSARIGVGREQRAFFHLVGLVARDLPSSNEAAILAAPVENVSLTPVFGLSLLDRQLTISGELTASAFSQDTRAAQASGSAPALLGLFTPRVGSRFDYAGHLETRYTYAAFPDTAIFDQITVLAAYERVQPGFVSLGRPYTRSDQEILRFQPQARLLDRRVQVALDLTSRRNNLSDNRNATLHRRQVHLSTQAQLTAALFVNADFTRTTNENNPVLDDPASQFLRQRLVTRTVLLGPVLTVPIQDLTHRIGLTVAVQNLADRTERDVSIDRRSVRFDNVTSTASHAVTLPSGLTLNSGISLIGSRAPSTDVRALGLNAGASTGLLKGRLHLGATLSVSHTRLTFAPPDGAAAGTPPERETSRQFGATATATFRVTGRDLLRLHVRGFTTRQPLRGHFQEIQSVLRFEHKF